MDNIDKFIHMSLHNHDGKWKSIGLTNLAAKMSADQCNDVLEQLARKQIDAAIARYDRLVVLAAPPCILANQDKLVRKAIRGSAEVGILKRRIKSFK